MKVERYNNLLACREGIDKIDDKILNLLEKRLQIVYRVGEIKNIQNAPIYRPEREKEIIDRLYNNAQTLSKEAIEAIFLEVFAVSRRYEKDEKVAFLGSIGSFTHQAAGRCFGSIASFVQLNSIKAVFDEVQTKRAKFGVVPIENNSHGAVGETLDLLKDTDVKIISEILMPIHMSLASNTEVKQVKKIYSKDIAFRQCRNFLYEHGLDVCQLIPVESTSKAAAFAKSNPHSAAICSDIAAKIHQLPVVFANVEDSTNAKRFVVVSDFKTQVSKNCKTSLAVRLYSAQKRGMLLRFLNTLDQHKINMTKLESYPAKKKEFGYIFYIDIDGHIDDENVKKAIEQCNGEVLWLGSYVRESLV